MKLNYLIKIIPFLATFTLIAILNISNQKVNTKLKILIWNTPSFSLGNYLAISTGAGFVLSYIVTTNLASIIKYKSVKSIQYKSETLNEGPNEDNFTSFETTNEKTLIERNINDPSPTMNAKFRVIGKNERHKKNYISNNIQYENSYDYDEQYANNNENVETINQEEANSADWNDDSFKSW